MKFGKVENPELYPYDLPVDHSDTQLVLASGQNYTPKVFIGCPRWAKAELKGFYPKGVKDELSYYSSQFNAIELNAYYYQLVPMIGLWMTRMEQITRPRVPISSPVVALHT